VRADAASRPEEHAQRPVGAGLGSGRVGDRRQPAGRAGARAPDLDERVLARDLDQVPTAADAPVGAVTQQRQPDAEQTAEDAEPDDRDGK
jgi:hypothetical protein